MKIYVAEFRPRNINNIPVLWKMTLEILGTGYYHTGVVVNSRYFEMDMRGDRGYYEREFNTNSDINICFNNLIISRAHPVNDTIDYYEVPKEFTEDEINTIIKWWEAKINNKTKYGLFRFFSLIFSKPFRWLSEQYYKRTGKILLFAKTETERNMRVCSTAVDESLKAAGYDAFKTMDESITVPGSFAKHPDFKEVYHGT